MATMPFTDDLLARLREIARTVGEAHISPLRRETAVPCFLKLNDAELRVYSARDELKRAELRSASAGLFVSTTLH